MSNARSSSSLNIKDLKVKIVEVQEAGMAMDWVILGTIWLMNVTKKSCCIIKNGREAIKLEKPKSRADIDAI